MVNEVETEVKRQLKSQIDKGIRKYGHPIDFNDISHVWIQDAIEEAVDMLQYLCAMKLRFESYEKVIIDDKRKSSYVDTNGTLVFNSSGQPLGIACVTDTFYSSTEPSTEDLHGLDRVIKFNSDIRGDIDIFHDGHQWTYVVNGIEHTFFFNYITGITTCETDEELMFHIGYNGEYP